MDAEPPAKTPATGGIRQAVWIGVISSIIATIVVSIFQPTVSFLNDTVISGIGIFFRGYLDTLYAAAGGSPTQNLIFMIFRAMFLIPLSVLSFMIGKKMSNEMQESEATRHAHTFMYRVSRNLYNSHTSVKLLVLMAIYTALTTGPIFSFTTDLSFQRRLSSLTAVISDQERKVIIGSWADMQSKADYDAIQEVMKSLATKYHKKLPPE